MSMQQTWDLAKKDSEAKFALAYKAWTEDLQKKAQSGDPKAKEKLLKESLKNSGLDKGPKFTSYCTFNADFGKNLDKLEAMVKAEKDAGVKAKSLKVVEVLKNSKLLPYFKHYCEKAVHIPEVIGFVTGGATKKPDVIYATYIKPGSPQELNIDGGLREIWDKSASAKNWSAAKGTIKKIFEIQMGYLGDHLPKCVAHETYGKMIRREIAGFKVEVFQKLAKQCLAISMQYAREVQGFGKRWNKMKPDFWTPLNVALNDIIGEIHELEKKYD